MKRGALRLGEKVLFGVSGLFLLAAIAGFAGMEVHRAHMSTPMFVATSHYDFTPEGLTGSERFRDLGCTSCHRAVRNGTNNGVSLDGIGSRRTFDYLLKFLAEPEATYRTQTMEHGPAKGASYVAELAPADRHALAVFLSELKASQGSPDARLPLDGHSSFIDEMVKLWAPSAWKSEYHDVREESSQVHHEGQ